MIALHIFMRISIAWHFIMTVLCILFQQDDVCFDKQCDHGRIRVEVLRNNAYKGLNTSKLDNDSIFFTVSLLQLHPCDYLKRWYCRALPYFAFVITSFHKVILFF